MDLPPNYILAFFIEIVCVLGRGTQNPRYKADDSDNVETDEVAFFMLVVATVSRGR